MPQFPDSLTDRYRRFRLRTFTAHAEHYEHLASQGQNPDTMVISCCDSRVDPETIFTALPGEMFVMRNVANLVPPHETHGRFHGVSSGIEFAVLNLHIKNLIVLGHSGCGGIKAALNQHAAIQTEAQFISRWMSMLDEARLSVLASHQTGNDAERQDALEKEGIKNSIKNLRTFPFVKEREEAGELALFGTHFDIGTGVLSVLDDDTGAFKPL